MKQVDKGIFLHRINYSESSLIITFYTQQHGIQTFLFQGAKKKAAALYPLSVCELTYYRRADSELGKLTEATPVLMLHNLVFDPLKSTIAFFVADVLKHCLKTDQNDDELFEFLLHEIETINEQDELAIFPTNFLIRFSYHLGIGPTVDDENTPFFNLQEGEFANYQERGAIVASGPGAELIRRLIVDPTDFSSADSSAKKLAFEIMLEFYKLHIPRFDVGNSLEIIREVLY